MGEGFGLYLVSHQGWGTVLTQGKDSILGDINQGLCPGVGGGGLLGLLCTVLHAMFSPPLTCIF